MNLETDNMYHIWHKWCEGVSHTFSTGLSAEGTFCCCAGLLGKAKDLDLNVVGVSFHVGSGATNPGETLRMLNAEVFRPMPSCAEGVIPQQTCCHRDCTASWGCTVHGSPMHAYLQAVPRQPAPHRAPARSCSFVNEISQLLLSSTLLALQPPLQRLSPWLAMYLMPFLCLASASLSLTSLPLPPGEPCLRLAVFHCAFTEWRCCKPIAGSLPPLQRFTSKAFAA